MKIQLQREINDRAYLYGSIYVNDEYICDSLEFGSGNELKKGIYSIGMLHSDMSVSPEICIVNEFAEVISKFVRNNTQRYKEIELRLDNNLICLGLKINTALLVMDEHSNHLLQVKVSGALARNEKVEFEIMNELKMQ